MSGLPGSGQIVYLGPRLADAGFTPRDHFEVQRWADSGRRFTLCKGESGPYAMLYEGGTAWASWGVMRQAADVLVWDCVKFTDIGRFGSMQDALAAIPSQQIMAPLANVIAFRPVGRTKWAEG